MSIQDKYNSCSDSKKKIYFKVWESENILFQNFEKFYVVKVDFTPSKPHKTSG